MTEVLLMQVPGRGDVEGSRFLKTNLEGIALKIITFFYVGACLWRSEQQKGVMPLIPVDPRN